MDKLQMITDEVKNIFTNGSKSHDLDHTMRVYSMCIHIGNIENANMEVLKLAAILHDIGRPIQDSSKGKICHAEVGASMAREMLQKYAYPDEIIQQVVHCIETHRYRNDKNAESIEAKILYDADKLDAIGAIGIGRAFVFARENGAKVHNKDVDVENTTSYSEEDTAYREFLVVLRYVKDKMLTSEGRRIAEGRHNFMVEFFDRINKEVEGII